MKEIVVGIGSIVFALFIVSIPFLCALSYALNLAIEIKFILTIITIGLIFWLASLIYTESEA